MKDKKPANRPLFEVNWEQVDNMCGIQCTGEEIAAVLGCDYAPITEDAQSLTYWGYVIFTDMTLEFDNE